MSACWKRRFLLLLPVAVLAAALVLVAGPKNAGACEDEELVELAVTHRAYDVPDEARFIDGLVTNDTSVSVIPKRVVVSFVEDTETVVDKWICNDPLAPGEWTTFHMVWPCGVPETWTPTVKALALPTDSPNVPLPLTVDSVSEPATDEAGARLYTVTVTNPNGFPVGDINFQGVEKEATSTAFVDTLLKYCCQSTIGPGDTVELTVKGRSPWSGDVTTDVYVTARELPKVTLSVNTGRPQYGSPMYFTARFMHYNGTPITGVRTLKLLGSTNGHKWYVVRYLKTWGTGVATGRLYPSKAMYYKAAYWDGGEFACATSEPVRVKPRKAIKTPKSPRRVKARRSFWVVGKMCAGARSTGKYAKIIVQRRKHGRWKKYGKAYVRVNRTTGRFSKKVRFSKKGTYRMRAYRYGVGYSRYKGFRVK